MSYLHVVTFNARGLRRTVKRRALFRFFHQNYPSHVIVLQETHSSQRDVSYWQAEWGSQIVVSHGLSTSECGVAVLLPRSLLQGCCVTPFYIDSKGRLVALNLAYDNCAIKLFAVYAPTQGNSRERTEFLQTLRAELQKLSPDECANTVMCGDFNIHLSELDIDKENFSLSQFSKSFLNLLNDFNFVDVWRDRFPTVRRYTWRQFAPLRQSRIDYVFVHRRLLTNHVLRSIDIRPGILSDHCIVNLEMILYSSSKGPGLWRFNNSLLEDDAFVSFVKNEIRKAKAGSGIYEGVSDLGLLLEMISGEIRAYSVVFSKRKARQKREQSQRLIEEFIECEIEMCNNPTDDIISQYQALKDRVSEIEEEKGFAAMIHSGARWMEQGEKPSKYFLGLCANKASKKHINVLQSAQGNMITENKDILEYCKSHFEDVYESKRDSSDQSRNFERLFGAINCPKLSETDRAACDGPLTNEECKSALDGMLNNKAPSVSGFSKEFFRFFWDDIGDLVVGYVNEAKENGMFFITQRRGVITLIPKKGDQKFIQNKRAICLLDIVYKTVAKVLASRMMSVMHKLVEQDQTGSIRGRFIGANLRTISDVIYYCETDQLEGILMALDFKNAFNTVEYDFVYAVLNLFNFGENFVSWVRLLHRGTELAIINNGFTSHWFTPSRGLQQGCPASAPIFALVVEILALQVRQSNDIRGISISGETFKISQYCDDTTIFVKDYRSAEVVLRTVEDFGMMSGLELNMNKCEFMWLGKMKCSQQSVCGVTPADKVKILGVWFSAIHDCTAINMNPVVNKIKKTLDRWGQRDLTIKGKITVAKSLVLSQLVYVMSAIQIPKPSLDMIQSHVMKFVWRGRPPKVAKRTICQTIEKGGLACPDVVVAYHASRAFWFVRLCKLEHVSFVKVFQARAQAMLKDIAGMNYGKEWIKSRLVAPFYKDVLAWFREACPVKEPSTGGEVRGQYIWNNVAILVDGKTLFSRYMSRRGVNLIDDLLDENGRFLSYWAISNRYPNLHINPLTYMGWCRAIPDRWRRIALLSTPLTCEERSTPPAIEIKDNMVPLRLVRLKYFYWRLLPESISTAQQRWIREGIDFGGDWDKVFALSFSLTISTKLQSLQYRILNRYLPTRRYLCIRKVVEDPFCNLCGEVETIEHSLFSCTEIKSFWLELTTAMNLRLTQSASRLSFSHIEILFGIINGPSIVNFLILLAKQFIIIQRYRDGTFTVDAFRRYLVKFFAMEKTIARKNDKFSQLRRRWQPFITESGELNL